MAQATSQPWGENATLFKTQMFLKRMSFKDGSVEESTFSPQYIGESAACFVLRMEDEISRHNY